MKFTIGLLVIGMAIASCANSRPSVPDANNTDLQAGDNLHQLSGIIYTASFHEGGGAPGANDDTIVRPYANVELLLVRLEDPSQKPKVVSKIVTDQEGRFAIKLPKGNYGFIGAEDRKKLSRGQCLPAQTANTTAHESTSVTWEMKPSCPVRILDHDLDEVVLIAHVHTMCYDCP